MSESRKLLIGLAVVGLICCCMAVVAFFGLRQFVLFLFSAISAMFGAANIQFGQLRKDLQRPSRLLPEGLLPEDGDELRDLRLVLYANSLVTNPRAPARHCGRRTLPHGP